MYILFLPNRLWCEETGEGALGLILSERDQLPDNYPAPYFNKKSIRNNICDCRRLNIIVTVKRHVQTLFDEMGLQKLVTILAFVATLLLS